MRSPRLSYEPLSVKHAPLLFPALSPTEVWTHIGPSEAPTLEALTARFAHLAVGPPPADSGERWINFAVRLAEAGPYCGRIEATLYGEWAEIAYLFGPSFWGQGLASEAVDWLRAYLLEHFQVAELWAATQPANLRSCRLLRRLGFREAAALRPLSSWDEGDLLFRWLTTTMERGPAAG